MSVPRSPFSKYLTTSDLDKRWQIYCVDTGCTEIKPGIVYLAPSSQTGWDEYWVGFDGSYPYAMMEEGFFTLKDPVFPVGLYDSLLQHFLDIIDLVTREPPGYQLQAGAAVVQIMATILAIRRQNRQSSETEQIVQKAKFLFEENKYSFIAMEAAAESLGLDYQVFRRIFKDYTGLPPYQYFLQIKINKAKTLLREQRYTVKEVAHMLAFENQYYFSRLFKRKTGIAPSMWQSERAIS
jgi:AraC-like DNA-binding protein